MLRGARYQGGDPAAVPSREATPISPPDLHTASGCKMLHCWPRILVNLTIPHLTPQTFLLGCDRLDPVLLGPAVVGGSAQQQATSPLMLWQARQLIEAFYGVLDTFPVYILDLFESYPGLWAARVLDGPLVDPLVANGSGGGGAGGSQHVAMAHLHTFCIPQLLVLSIALNSVDSSFPNTPRSDLVTLSTASCALALRSSGCCTPGKMRIWFL